MGIKIESFLSFIKDTFLGIVTFIKKHIVGIIAVIIGTISMIQLVRNFKNRPSPGNFVKDPSDPNKLIVADPKTGGNVGVQLPKGTKADDVKIVSKPTDVLSNKIEVKNQVVDRKGATSEKVTAPNIPASNQASTIEMGDVSTPAKPASASDWLGTNNSNFKG